MKEKEKERKGNIDVREILIGCLSHTPIWGPGHDFFLLYSSFSKIDEAILIFLSIQILGQACLYL